MRLTFRWTVRWTVVAIVLLVFALLRCVGEEDRSDAGTAVGEEDRAWAARARRIIQSPDMDNPGREAANLLKYGWPGSMVPILEGLQTATPERLAEARRKVRELVETAEKGPQWPAFPTLCVPRLRESPKVDGMLDDESWTSALTLRTVFPFNTTNAVASPLTVWSLGWNEEGLWVAFECADEDLQAPSLPRDGEVYFADCVELFLLPEFRSGLYWELVVGPTGCVFDALHAKNFKAWGMISRVDQNIEGLEVVTHLEGTPNDASDRDRGYTVEVKIPWREVPSYTRGNLPRPGDILRLMLVRLDKAQGQPLQAYSFKPLLSWGHNIWNHVPVVLGD